MQRLFVTPLTATGQQRFARHSATLSRPGGRFVARQDQHAYRPPPPPSPGFLRTPNPYAQPRPRQPPDGIPGAQGLNIPPPAPNATGFQRPPASGTPGIRQRGFGVARADYEALTIQHLSKESPPQSIFPAAAGQVGIRAKQFRLLKHHQIQPSKIFSQLLAPTLAQTIAENLGWKPTIPQIGVLKALEVRRDIQLACSPLRGVSIGLLLGIMSQMTSDRERSWKITNDLTHLMVVPDEISLVQLHRFYSQAISPESALGSLIGFGFESTDIKSLREKGCATLIVTPNKLEAVEQHFNLTTLRHLYLDHVDNMLELQRRFVPYAETPPLETFLNRLSQKAGGVLHHSDELGGLETKRVRVVFTTPFVCAMPIRKYMRVNRWAQVPLLAGPSFGLRDKIESRQNLAGSYIKQNKDKAFVTVWNEDGTVQTSSNVEEYSKSVKDVQMQFSPDDYSRVPELTPTLLDAMLKHICGQEFKRAMVVLPRGVNRKHCLDVLKADALSEKEVYTVEDGYSQGGSGKAGAHWELPEGQSPGEKTIILAESGQDSGYHVPGVSHVYTLGSSTQVNWNVLVRALPFSSAFHGRDWTAEDFLPEFHFLVGSNTEMKLHRSFLVQGIFEHSIAPNGVQAASSGQVSTGLEGEQMTAAGDDIYEERQEVKPGQEQGHHEDEFSAADDVVEGRQA